MKVKTSELMDNQLVYIARQTASSINPAAYLRVRITVKEYKSVDINTPPYFLGSGLEDWNLIPNSDDQAYTFPEAKDD